MHVFHNRLISCESLSLSLYIFIEENLLEYSSFKEIVNRFLSVITFNIDSPFHLVYVCPKALV